MATSISVDATNELAQVTFVDDHNDPTAPPAGVIVTITGDNDAVCTVAAAAPDTANPNAFSAALTPVAVGTVNLNATVTDASGNPLLEADGVTPWPAIDPVALTVDPGAAVGARFAVTP